MKIMACFALSASALIAATGPVRIPQTPLAFEPNAGETDSHVRYLAHAQHAMVWLTERGAVLGVGRQAVQMRFEGGNLHPKIAAEDRWPGVSNYYLSKDPSKWRAGVPHFGRVRYSDIYPGISAVFYGNPSDLEYDFVLNAGADPSKIRLAFDGVDSVSLDGHGALVLKSGGTTVRNLQPKISQDGRPVNGRWVVRGKRSAGFVVDNFDRSKNLTIDPVLSYATYLGGSSADYPGGIAVDSQGNIYVAGNTLSTDYPLVNAFDSTLLSIGSAPLAAFTKINPAATGTNSRAQLVYSTYYATFGTLLVGGAVTGAAVDSAGNAYFTGGTGDSLPVMNPLPNEGTYRNAFDCVNGAGQLIACEHGFVAEVSPTGQLLFSTYLGGSSGDVANGIAADANGNIYVCGSTYSTDFPTTATVPGGFNPSAGSAAFVTMIGGSASGHAITFSTLLVGPGPNSALGVAADPKGNIYVAGYAGEAGFPVSANAFQSTYPGKVSAFAAILNPSANPVLTYGTLLGGSDNQTAAFAVAPDGSGNIIVAGETAAQTFPQTGTPQSFSVQAAFVTKLSPKASGSSQLLYSTVLAGGGGTAYGVQVDPAGHIWVAGDTPGSVTTTPNAFQPYNVSLSNSLGPFETGFFAELDPTQNGAASVLYSSLLGGTETFVYGIVLDPTGKTLYIAASSDTVGGLSVAASGKFYGAGGAITYSGGIKIGEGPVVTPSALQTHYGGQGDDYIAVFDLTQTGPLMTTVENGAGLGAQPILTLSPGLIFTIKGSNLGPAAATGGVVNNGVVTNNVAGVQVFVDGNPCPLLYLSATQINAIAPYEIAAKVNGMVAVQVVYNNISGNVIYMPVVTTNPGLFSYGDGSGQGAILNADQSLNGPGNPAARGSIAVFYATGEGQTNPPGVDGALATEPVGGIPAPMAPVSMTIGNVPVPDFVFAGTVPTGVAGALQINAIIPQNVTPGSAVPVVLTIGGNSSPNGLTMAIQ